ncbi:MAG: TIGR04076 family protein [Candidatus Zixiibacteriota bacterium]
MGDFEVRITIKEIRGSGVCPAGHKIGEVFRVGEGKLCVWAEHTILPFATALRLGGEIPWGDNKDFIEVACPDADNTVIFELKRGKAKRRKFFS